MLAALNGLFHFLAGTSARAKFLKVQRRLFRDAGRELTRQEYERLLAAARARGQERAGPVDGGHLRYRYPGVRGAVYHRGGRPAGSDRDLPQGKNSHHSAAGKLCRKLLKYARKHKTVSGEIFLTRNGTSLSPPPDLDRAETAVQVRRSGICQGVSSQSAALVRHHFLPGLQGHRAAGRCAGPQFH